MSEVNRQSTPLFIDLITDSSSDSDGFDDNDVDVLDVVDQYSDVATAPTSLIHSQTATGTMITGRRGGAFFPNITDRKTSKYQTTSKSTSRRLPLLDTLPDLPPPKEDQKVPGFSCYVQGNYITFARSDCDDPSNLPAMYDEPPHIKKDGTVNFLYRLPTDSPTVLHWKRKIGNHIARKILHLPNAKSTQFYLTAFPRGYVLAQHQNGSRYDPRKDAYLFGSRKVNRFRSPGEFYPHAKWLLFRKGDAQMRPRCQCKYCSPDLHKRTQTEQALN